MNARKPDCPGQVKAILLVPPKPRPPTHAGEFGYVECLLRTGTGKNRRPRQAPDGTRSKSRIPVSLPS